MVHLPDAAGAGGRRGQRRGKVGRNEGRVAGHGQQGIRALRRRPVEPGQHAGERPLTGERPIRQDRQPERCEARGIAIGAQRDRRGLRQQPVNDPFKQRLAGKFEQRLVDPAQPPRVAAGQDQRGLRHGRAGGKAGMGRAMGLEPTASKTTTWRSAN